MGVGGPPGYCVEASSKGEGRRRPGSGGGDLGGGSWGVGSGAGILGVGSGGWALGFVPPKENIEGSRESKKGER